MDQFEKLESIKNRSDKLIAEIEEFLEEHICPLDKVGEDKLFEQLVKAQRFLKKVYLGSKSAIVNGKVPEYFYKNNLH